MRLTDRTSLTTAALNDLMHIVDVSDKTDSDEGTSKKIRIDDMGFQLYSQRGKANGYTPLNNNVKIDTQYLPSYVDDVLEFTNRAAFPTTGETGKIYIAKDTNFCYRWSGTVYVQVGGGGSGDVETVFGRMGNIVASQGDYKTSLITNNSNVSGAYLDDALDWLNANKVPTSRTISTGSGLTGGGNLTANRTLSVDFGTSSGTVAQGNDSRINNGQTAYSWGNHASAGYVPTSRTITAGSHLSGGGNLSVNRTLTLTPSVSNWITDNQGNDRMFFGSETDSGNGAVFRASNQGQQLQYRDVNGNAVFRVFDSGFVSANSGANFSGNVTANGFITNSIGGDANSIISDISAGALFAQVSGTGSINFPTEFGQSFGVRGNTDQRSFFFYKPNGNNNTLYFSDYTGSEWRHQQIWHSNNLRSDSQNDSRYAIMNDVTQNLGQLTIRTDNSNNRGLRLLNNSTGQSSFFYMDNSDELNINNSNESSRPVYINKGGTGGLKVGGGINSLGTITASGTITGANLSGTNTGDQIAGTGLSGTSTLSVTNIAAGSSTSGALRYNGTTKSAGRLYGGSSNPSATNRLNYDGHLYVTELTAVGTITANGFYESSDIRLKDNVEPLNYGLKEIEKIDTHTWNWKEDGKSDIGLIAQELELIMPELVKTDEEGYKSVNYPKLIPVLINAIKELSNGKKS